MNMFLFSPQVISPTPVVALELTTMTRQSVPVHLPHIIMVSLHLAIPLVTQVIGFVLLQLKEDVHDKEKKT